MDFFESQDRARKHTGVLVVYFVLAVVAIILSVYLAASLALHWGGAFLGESDGTAAPSAQRMPLWNPLLFLGVCTVTLITVLLGSVVKMTSLSDGGARVAELLGGRLLAPQSTDPDEQRVLNVVEEMALASGISVPPVYVLEQEISINAFAAGTSPDTAVIGITRGTLEHLKRDELQGVIGHEFSHILNGDMRLNLRLIGLLHGILVIAIVGQLVLRGLGRGTMHSSRSSREKGGGGAVVAILAFAVALVAIGYIGVFFGRLIKSAVSRQREYLADASAVQFTRNPLGLAGALKKIGALSDGSRIRTARAEEASHLFFSNALRSSMAGMLSTHPPLIDRIRRLEPQFDGTFPKPSSFMKPSPAEREPPPLKKREAHRMPGMEALPGGMVLPGVGDALPGVLQIPVLAALAVNPSEIAGLVGAPMEAHIEEARRILDAIPTRLRDSLRDPHGARAVVFALLLDRKPEVLEKQWTLLESGCDAATLQEMRRLEAEVRAVDRRLALPMVDLAVTGLRGLAEGQYREFRGLVDALTAADQSIDLFEYAVVKTLVRKLDQHFGLEKPIAVSIYSVRGVTPAISCVLSMLARVSTEDPQAAENAFRAALKHVAEAHADYTFLPPGESGLQQVDEALTTLRATSALVKKKVMVAALQSLVSDQVITLNEAELYRAMAHALDCPVPPWLLAGGTA